MEGRSDKSNRWSPEECDDDSPAHHYLEKWLEKFDRITESPPGETNARDGAAILLHLHDSPAPLQSEMTEYLADVAAERPSSIEDHIDELVRYCAFEGRRAHPLTEVLVAVSERKPEYLVSHLDHFIARAIFTSWTQAHEDISTALANVARATSDPHIHALCDRLLADPTRRHKGIGMVRLVARSGPDIARPFLRGFVPDLSADYDTKCARETCNVLVELARDDPRVVEGAPLEALCERATERPAHPLTRHALSTCGKLLRAGPRTLGQCRHPLQEWTQVWVTDDWELPNLMRDSHHKFGVHAVRELAGVILDEPRAIPCEERAAIGEWFSVATTEINHDAGRYSGESPLTSDTKDSLEIIGRAHRQLEENTLSHD